jgi:cytochrome P450
MRVWHFHGHGREVARVHWLELLPIFTHPYRGYLRLHARHGKTFVVSPPAGPDVIFTVDEALVRELMVDHADSLARPPDVVRTVFRDAVGRGIVAAGQTQWKDRRQRGSRRVHTAIASAQQLHALQICLRDFVDEIQAQAARSPSFDLLPFIERFTLDVALRLVCERRVLRHGERFAALLDAARAIMSGTQQLVDVRRNALTAPLPPRLRDAVARRGCRRLEAPIRVMAQFEPDPEVRELLLATYENPSTCLSWTMVWLAMYPACQERLRQEAEAVDLLGESTLNAPLLDSLTYAGAVVRESLRLCPPIAYLARCAIDDIELEGLTIRKGSHVIVVPWCLHMDPRHWLHPARFAPERFLDGDSSAHGRLYSFGVGPRMCVGSTLAIHMLSAAITALARVTTWSLAPGFQPSWPTGRYPWNEKTPCRLRVEARNGQ